MDRADIDDPAAATRGDHVAGGGLGGQERRGDIDRERLLEELLAERLEGRQLRRDGGVVDEDVDPPEPFDGGVDDPGSQARVLCEVGLLRFDAAPHGTAGRGHALERGGAAPVVEHEVRARLCERRRDGRSQPGAGARHDRDPARQAALRHRTPPIHERPGPIEDGRM